MTDFDYDVYQKKSTARGAKYKVNGSKSKKCTLCTDYMTPSQIKKMNGEMVTFNMNEPVDWGTFCKLPAEVGKEYLLKLIDTYNVNYSRLADMFHINRNKISDVLGNEPYNIHFGRGTNMSLRNRSEWNAFIGISNNEEIEKSDEIVQTESKETDTSPVIIDNNANEKSESEQQKMFMSDFNMTFDGILDVAGIANSLKMVIGAGRKGVIRIQCSFDNGGDIE